MRTEPSVAAAGSGAVAPLPSGPIVVDASYVIALLQAEPAATALTRVLGRAVMTSVTAGEVFDKLSSGSGADPVQIHSTLTALGVRIDDLPLSAAQHFPGLRLVDAARRAEQKINGERAAALSLADLCVLGYARAIGRPVLTGDRHWSTLARHGLSVEVINFRGRA